MSTKFIGSVSRPGIVVVMVTVMVMGGLAVPAQETDSPTSTLPAGHPQLSTPQTPESVVPEVPEDSGIGEAGLVWDVPDSWVEETPSSSMRRAQYRIVGESGDAECVVFYFGPGQGGEPMANAERWGSQFIQPDGRNPIEVLETSDLEVGDVSVLMSEITGTYGGGMAMGGRRTGKPDQMLLGAIAQGSDANWFFKLTGPQATVGAERERFEEMILSLRRGQAE